VVAQVTVTTALTGVLKDYVGTIVARSIVEGASNRSGVDPEHVTAAQVTMLVEALDQGVIAFVADPVRERECVSRLRSELEKLCGSHVEGGHDTTRLQVDITEEYDIVTARNHTRTICDDAGFSVAEQVKIATVVSELARNIVLYVGQGRIEIEMIDGLRRGIQIKAIDRGQGIPDVEHVFSGAYRSKTGMGVGLLGTKRLMDEFEIDSAPGRGTRITCRKFVT
jgi:serine/threonine-protein kinase RsbT